MQIHRQIVMLLDRFLNPENMRKDLAFVVGSAACKNVAVLQNRLERGRVPKLQRIRRLHIVMPVDQHCPAPGLLFIMRPDDWMSTRGNKLRLQAEDRKSTRLNSSH